MKANELMIGDWLQHASGKYFQVTRIDMWSDGSVHFACGHPHLWEYNNEFSPVPLTAEILERNFVKNGTNRYVVYGGNSYIKDMTNFFELHINFVDFKLEQQIFYVHKLQHALKLCGIEKEIEL